MIGRVGKSAAIVQSNYVPWRGYFDLIRRVDVFVLYDCVQYTKRDWRNRNQIKTPRGLEWLTIPVATKGRYEQSIDQVTISSVRWAERHVGAIRASYRGAAGWDAHGAWLTEILYEAARLTRLSEINESLLRRLSDRLGIDGRKIVQSTDLAPRDELTSTERSRRMADLCQAVGATEYLSGPAARAYLDEEPFAAAGVAVTWMSYPDYPIYPQLWGAFEPRVSIIDLLLNVPDRPGDCIR
jgi:hypothetical protein